MDLEQDTGTSSLSFTTTVSSLGYLLDPHNITGASQSNILITISNFIKFTKLPVFPTVERLPSQVINTYVIIDSHQRYRDGYSSPIYRGSHLSYP
jgi:hypothetical protein